jgi:hypothetical protein
VQKREGVKNRREEEGGKVVEKKRNVPNRFSGTSDSGQRKSVVGTGSTHYFATLSTARIPPAQHTVREREGRKDIGTAHGTLHTTSDGGGVSS